MRPLAEAPVERLETAGIPVIPVTAAPPAGWCDQMARTWLG